tara:strand:+ start:53 stop:394 length:342 start_codon:yes stop_codon:yes gene_type:complete
MLALTNDNRSKINNEACRILWDDELQYDLGPDRKLGMHMLPELLKLLGEGIELAESVRDIPMTRREKRDLINLMIKSLTGRGQKAVTPQAANVIRSAYGHGEELFKAWGIGRK